MLSRCISGYALPAVLLISLSLGVIAFESYGEETRIYEGAADNIASDASSQMRLELSIDGESVSGAMIAYSPLNGSGRVSGNLMYNMCKLQGRTEDGSEVEFNGTLDPKSYEGNYTITFADGTLEYGSFEMRAVSIAVSKNPRPKALVSGASGAVNKPNQEQIIRLKKTDIKPVNRVSAPPN